MTSDNIVFTSALVTVGSTVAANIAPKSIGGQGSAPSPRLLIGAGLTFTGLAILADFAPKLATPLAASIAITALTYYGVPIMDAYFTGKHNTTGKTLALPPSTTASLNADVNTILADPGAYTIVERK